MKSETDLISLFIWFDLPPGCSAERLNERYRVLASLFHPDQVMGEKRKIAAEQEMKLLNDRRERILTHLRSAEHKPTGNCRCRPVALTAQNATRASTGTAANAPQQSPAPSPKKSTEQAPAQDEEKTRKPNPSPGTTYGTSSSNTANNSLDREGRPGKSASPQNDRASFAATYAYKHFQMPDELKTNKPQVPPGPEGTASFTGSALRRERLIKTGRLPKDAKPGYETSYAFFTSQLRFPFAPPKNES